MSFSNPNFPPHIRPPTGGGLTPGGSSSSSSLGAPSTTGATIGIMGGGRAGDGERATSEAPGTPTTAFGPSTLAGGSVGTPGIGRPPYGHAHSSSFSASTVSLAASAVGGPESAMSFYFAYGSNLSITQMVERCPSSNCLYPGFLKGWKWVINERGYANLVRLEGMKDVGQGTLADWEDVREDLVPDGSMLGPEGVGVGNIIEGSTEPQKTPNAMMDVDPFSASSSASSPTSTRSDPNSNNPSRPRSSLSGPGVYGLIYSLGPGDESSLDAYEGLSHDCYGKLHLEISILPGFGPVKSSSGARLISLPNVITYVDFERQGDTKNPRDEYKGRMERGFREGGNTGLPAEWVEVMRGMMGGGKWKEAGPGQIGREASGFLGRPGEDDVTMED